LKLDVLRPVDRTPTIFTVTPRGLPFDSNGKLNIDDIPEGKYLASIYPLPPTWYLADIRQGDVSVFDSGFKVSPQAAPVRFVLNATGSSISGMVRNTDGRPVSEASLILVPPDDSRWNVFRFLKSDSDRGGKFSFRGVRPGNYTLFAFENPPFNAWLNSEFMSHYENRGVPVHVEAGAAIEMQNLIAIPPENPFSN